MPRQAWRFYLVVLLTVVAGYFFAAPAGWIAVWWQVVVGYLATAAILVGAWRNTGDRPAWCWFAVGVFANSSGILVEAIVTHVGTPEFGSIPSLADASYLILYPAFVIGLALLIRKRTAWPDWGALVDATMVLAGLSLPAWIFLIRPGTVNPGLSPPGHLVSVAYPVGDVMLIAMMVRLQLGAPRPRAPALRLMTASLLAFVFADTAWAVFHLIAPPNDVTQRLTETTSLLAYVLFGAAALHPSARRVGSGHQDAARRSLEDALDTCSRNAARGSSSPGCGSSFPLSSVPWDATPRTGAVVGDNTATYVSSVLSLPPGRLASSSRRPAV